MNLRDINDNEVDQNLTVNYFILKISVLTFIVTRIMLIAFHLYDYLKA